MKNKDLMNVLKQQPMDAEIWIESWDKCEEEYISKPADSIVVSCKNGQYSVGLKATIADWNRCNGRMA